MKEQEKEYYRESAGLLTQLREVGEIFDLMFSDADSLSYEDIRIRTFYRRELRLASLLRELKDIGEIMKINDIKIKEALRNTGGFLLDIARLKSSIIIPANGEELQSLATQVMKSHITGEPIPLFTPFCPDWSRDSKGRYDFRSLGGEISYIAQKFFLEGRSLLSAFANNNVPYRGELIFADWGLETEIDARDTYGEKLSQDDIQACFASTLANTDECLLELQCGKDGILFEKYRLTRMTDFYRRAGHDPEKIYRQQEKFFNTDSKGVRLVEELYGASLDINKERLGLTQGENRKQAIQNLAEYATLGQAFGEKGFIVAAESSTSTRAYNLSRRHKLPVFFIKGKRSINEGVNIL
jgi:hypothetical protein